MLSRSVCAVVKAFIEKYFSLKNIPWCRLLCPFICNGHFGCFHVLTVINNAAMNVVVQAPLGDRDFVSFRYVPRSGIAELHGSSNFNFLRTLHTVFHSGYVSLHPCQRWTRNPFSPHISSLSDDSHSNRSKLLSHCGFAFPQWLVLLTVEHFHFSVSHQDSCSNLLTIISCFYSSLFPHYVQSDLITNTPAFISACDIQWFSFRLE